MEEERVVRSKPYNVFSVGEHFFISAVVYWKGLAKDFRSEATRRDEDKLELDADLNRVEDTDDATRQQEVGHEDALVNERPTSLQRWMCNSCGFIFQTGDGQRSHFKSDYHRLNIKRKLLGKKPLSEEQFEAFAEGGGGHDSSLSSISGSDTASDDSDVEDIVKIDFKDCSKHYEEENASRFFSFQLQSGEIVSLWRCVLAHNKELLQNESDNISMKGSMDRSFLTEMELLQRLNLLCGSSIQSKCLWIVLLNAGGHFAGVVKDMKNGSILAHQTFHRYVVRAKAGGRQSSKDATGRAPKSAGASLRRYNELALEKDIKELLKNWQQYVDSADRIFVHAPSRNSQALFGGKIPVLIRTDNRIRQVPFTTRRPTFREAKKVLHDLSTLINRVDARNSSSAICGLKKSSIGQPKKSKEENVLAGLDSSTESKNKLELDESSQLGHDAHLNPSGAASQECTKNLMNLKDTLLHEAAKSGNAAWVWELLDNGSDPCVRDFRGRSPYALASTKETRNAFRRFMAYHPDKWNWYAANVPSPLTEELEVAQALKQTEKVSKRKAKEKERKKQRKAQQKALQVEAELEGSSTSATQCHLESTKMIGLASHGSASEDPAEILKKLQIKERELRAAAAERRLNEMANINKQSSSNLESVSTAKIVGVTSPTHSDGNQDANICSCCGTSLAEKVPFYRYRYKYCSTTCVHVHRKFLESEE